MSTPAFARRTLGRGIVVIFLIVLFCASCYTPENYIIFIFMFLFVFIFFMIFIFFFIFVYIIISIFKIMIICIMKEKVAKHLN